MQKIIFILFAIFVGQITAQAQNPMSFSKEEQELVAAVDTFFEYLHRRDTAQLRQTFHPQVSMKSVQYKNGLPVLTETTLPEMLQNIGKLPMTTKIQEKLLGYHVQIDAELATVWTPYQFFINDQLSHCGANAFTLVKTDGKWLIINIIDTRRKNCK